MSYLALARKYRPETFADVVGQEHVTATLRAAQRKDKLSHAYLFAGPRGCGKTTVARLLAKTLNCAEASDGGPCGRCAVCQGIAQGTFLDVLEIDAASHTGVDNVRELRDMAQYAPGKDHNRVFIIDEVHMLSKGAFNALLKILEEPPTRVYFFFATTEPNKIPRTILSRCQRFDFRLLTREELGERLTHIAGNEGVELDPTGLRVLVSLAEGSLRDGISLLDQAIASCEGSIDEAALVALFGLIRSEVYLDLNDAILARDAAAALNLVDELAKAGQSLDTFAAGVVNDFRNLLLLRVDEELIRAVDLPPDQLGRLRDQSARWAATDLLALLDRSVHHYERIHRSTQPRILMEAAVVEFCHFESRVILADLVRRLDDLAGAGGAVGAPGGSGTGSSAEDPGAGRGARRAGPSAAGAARAVPSGAAKPAASRNTEAGAAERPRATGAATTIPGWTDLVSALMESHPGLASCLIEALPSVDPEGRRLTLAYPAEKSFQLRQLEPALGIIEEKVAAIWGKKLRVTAVVAERGRERQEIEGVRRAVAPSDREILERACQEDRPLNELVEILRGEPLPEAERENWPAAEADATDPDSEKR